ncbi:MAG: AMP-binding protein [Colwellia sp.]|nr:AMP-binding protein [Colwellia sp.]MCW8863641.1 AMP-binding protein [Colwellia sp.]MCW9080391.1 AMP-binding protein [Colwellia sp.]
MEKIWLKSYPENINHEIDTSEAPTLLALFEQTFAKFENNTAFKNMGQSLTFKQLDIQSRHFAAYLQHSGLKQGDAVAIMMPNLLQYPVAMMAILRAGLVVVNVNPQYTPRELKHQLNDAGAKAIIIIENFAATFESVAAETGVKQVFLTKLGDMQSLPKKWLINFAVKHVKKIVPQFSIPNTVCFTNAIKQGASLDYKRPTVSPQDLAFLQYTGGTTGVAKGAMLTQQNIVANLEQISAFLDPLITSDKEVVVTALPLYHIFALVANCLAFVKYGCTNVLITDPRDIDGFIKELSRVNFTAITGVNTLFNALLNQDAFHKLDFSQLKFGLGGGMAIQRVVAERWFKSTNTVLLEGYGLTECSPVVTCNPHNIDAYTGSIGLPLPSTEIRLVDENGEQVNGSAAGEMQVRGPQVMKGYFNRPEATAEVIDSEGWLSTGDIASVDDKGFFKIVDRKKDMILVSGFNVYPNEIEDIVASLDNVVEVAAIGVPHEVSGEIVKLFAVKANDDLSENDVIEHCRAHLTAYKVPKMVEFRQSLPKSNVGKILRKDLREV